MLELLLELVTTFEKLVVRSSTAPSIIVYTVVYSVNVIVES